MRAVPLMVSDNDLPWYGDWRDRWLENYWPSANRGNDLRQARETHRLTRAVLDISVYVLLRRVAGDAATAIHLSRMIIDEYGYMPSRNYWSRVDLPSIYK